MNSRTFFNILLKVIGIFILKDAVYAVIQAITTITAYISIDELLDGYFIVFLLISLAYFIVPFLLLFKTEEISKLLKLRDNIEEEIPLNIHRSTLLSIAIIVLGGLILIESIPNFIAQVWEYFKMKRESVWQAKLDSSYIVLNGIKVVIGLLLLGNYRPIVNFIEHRRKKKPER